MTCIYLLPVLIKIIVQYIWSKYPLTLINLNRFSSKINQIVKNKIYNINVRFIRNHPICLKIIQKSYFWSMMNSCFVCAVKVEKKSLLNHLKYVHFLKENMYLVKIVTLLIVNQQWHQIANNMQTYMVRY